MTAIVYPYLEFKDNSGNNPYIRDFVEAFRGIRMWVGDPARKNPLFKICFDRIDANFYFFHWIEDVANNKFGYLQALMAFIFLFRIKHGEAKIIWFMHNKKGHTTKHPWIRKWLISVLTRYSYVIVTHAKDGLEVVDPRFREKVVYVDHPTKYRLPETENINPSPAFDLLIWGTISPYKGVLEFLQFAKRTQSNLKIRIVGKCSDKRLAKKIEAAQTPFTQFENRSVSFEELGLCIGDAKFVLVPYAAESILSSGVLMDSLSYGSKVIGPNVGSFKDYASSEEVDVFTFDTFEDIEQIVRTCNHPVNMRAYSQFLFRNSWIKFATTVKYLSMG